MTPPLIAVSFCRSALLQTHLFKSLDLLIGGVNVCISWSMPSTIALYDLCSSQLGTWQSHWNLSFIKAVSLAPSLWLGHQWVGSQDNRGLFLIPTPSMSLPIHLSSGIRMDLPLLWVHVQCPVNIRIQKSGVRAVSTMYSVQGWDNHHSRMPCPEMSRRNLSWKRKNSCKG